MAAVNLDIKNHECEMRFASQHHPERHIEEQRKRCPACPYRGKGAAQVMTHIKQQHLRVREHACNVCGRMYITRSQANAHEARAHGEYKDRFRCDNCSH